jgi:DNA invertase Pin-like site-specific DNA recombinase
LRVSTDEQGESGAGLSAQADSCHEWAAKNGAGVAGPFSDDGVSGAAGLEKRPQLLAAISTLCRGDVLLVAKRDRIARDPIVTAMVEAAVNRKGARVVSPAGEGTEGDNPTDILMRRIVDAFSEYERLIIKARTSAALQAKIRRGERCGKVRFGYNLAVDGKTLVPHDAEQEAIAIMRELRAAGQTFRQIAGELARRGIHTKGGHEWQPMTICRILKRAA